MHSYERVATALKRQQPDRVPILTYLNSDSEQASPELRRFITENSDVFYTFRIPMGFLCTGIEGSISRRALDDGWTEAFHEVGSTVFREITKPGPERYPGYRKHLISSPADIEQLVRMPFVPPADNGELARWIRMTNASARAHYSVGAFVRIVVYAPAGLIGMNTSPEDFAVWTIEHHELLMDCQSVLLRNTLLYLEYVMERLEFPAVFNLAGAEHATPPLMSPRAFDDYVLDFDRQIVDLIHGFDRLICYHCHGKVAGFIPKFIEMGADGLHPLEPPGATGDCDLTEVKRRFGRGICLIGNMQYDDLSRLTPRQVSDTVKDVMTSAKQPHTLAELHAVSRAPAQSC